MSRRLRGITVSVEMVGDLARTLKTVPKTATFNHAYFDHGRNAFVCYFEDDTFAEVAESGIIPIDVVESKHGV